MGWQKCSGIRRSYLDVKNEDYCQIVLKKIDEDTLNKSLENIDNGLNHGDKERQNERG